MLNKMYDVVMGFSEVETLKILSVLYHAEENHVIKRELYEATRFEANLMLVLILCGVDRDYVLEIFKDRIFHD